MMTFLAMMGWGALVIVALLMLIGGAYMILMISAFSGEADPIGIAIMLIGVALLASAIWLAPFSINFTMGHAA